MPVPTDCGKNVLPLLVIRLVLFAEGAHMPLTPNAADISCAWLAMENAESTKSIKVSFFTK